MTRATHPCLRGIGAVCLLGAILLAAPAWAAWQEGSATILSLDEFLPRLGAELQAGVDREVGGDTPIVLAAGELAAGPKALRAALIQSGLALSERGGALSVVDPHPLGERERAERRLRSVFPVRPRGNEAEAVGAGGVVFYGEPAEPPFLVEVAGEEIQINGIAVYPAPGAFVAPPAPSAAQIDKHDLLARAGAAYMERVGAGDGASARRLLEENLAQLPGVASMRWTSETDLDVVHADGTVETYSMAPEAKEAQVFDPAVFDEHLRELAEGLRSALAADYTILAGATYLRTVTDLDGDALRRRIGEIRASAESDALKLARLQAWTGQRDAAADLLYAR